MRTAAILPVKRLQLAKQRLRPSIDADLRAGLARAMIADVLSALAACDSIEQTIIITNEPSVASVARADGALVVPDGAERGQSAAVSIGVAHALSAGFERVLCVPGDCPTLDPSELQRLLGRSRPNTAAAIDSAALVVIVPDRHGTGTNGLLLSPPDAIAPSFGPGSFERHRELAAAAGVRCAVARPPSLLLDVDTGEDLRALRARLQSVAAPGRQHARRAQRARAAFHRRPLRWPSEPLAVAGLSARALGGLPEIAPGDDLAQLIAAATRTRSRSSAAAGLADGQIVVIAHKAVSKAEGAIVALADVRPGARALALAAEADAQAPGAPARDPRAIQVVLDESAEVLRAQRGVLICRTRHGFVCANAGVDASNASEPDTLVLLPRDPDDSARRIRARLRECSERNVAVLIADSFGRAWRHGQCDVAIGCAGMAPLQDWRGRSDAAGRELRATWLAIADAAAACAELVRAKDSREPVVLVDGLSRFVSEEDGPGAAALLRAPDEDLFR